MLIFLIFFKGFRSKYRGGCDMRDPPWQGTPSWFHYPHHFHSSLSGQSPPLKLTWPHRSQWRSTTKVTAEVNHTRHSDGRPQKSQQRSTTLHSEGQPQRSQQKSTVQATVKVDHKGHVTAEVNHTGYRGHTGGWPHTKKSWQCVEQGRGWVSAGTC